MSLLNGIKKAKNVVHRDESFCAIPMDCLMTIVGYLKETAGIFTEAHQLLEAQTKPFLPKSKAPETLESVELDSALRAVSVDVDKVVEALRDVDTNDERGKIPRISNHPDTILYEYLGSVEPASASGRAPGGMGYPVNVVTHTQEVVPVPPVSITQEPIITYPMEEPEETPRHNVKDGRPGPGGPGRPPVYHHNVEQGPGPSRGQGPRHGVDQRAGRSQAPPQEQYDGAYGSHIQYQPHHPHGQDTAQQPEGGEQRRSRRRRKRKRAGQDPNAQPLGTGPAPVANQQSHQPRHNQNNVQHNNGYGNYNGPDHGGNQGHGGANHYAPPGLVLPPAPMPVLPILPRYPGKGPIVTQPRGQAPMTTQSRAPAPTAPQPRGPAPAVPQPRGPAPAVPQPRGSAPTVPQSRGSGQNVRAEMRLPPGMVWQEFPPLPQPHPQPAAHGVYYHQ